MIENFIQVDTNQLDMKCSHLIVNISRNDLMELIANNLTLTYMSAGSGVGYEIVQYGLAT